MARQRGLIQLEGTIGGINFYIRKGTALARQSGGGFNGKAIKTKASMVRVRENGSEFGAASRVKKLFRMSVQEALLNSHDGTLHGRMMGLVQGIKVCDLDSERGKRSVWSGLKTTFGAQLLTDFLFTPKQDLSWFVGSFASISNLGSRCDFSGLHLTEEVFKKSATHVVLTYFVVDYDSENLEFTRYVAEKVTVVKGALPVTLTSFELTGLPAAYTFRMSFLALQFYERCNGTLVVLKEQGMTGLRCLRVFDV
jgi:hypothetical protein